MTYGKILIIGPSRAGKSYLANAWKQQGLPAIDAEEDTDLIAWREDATGQRVTNKPATPTKEWFSQNHFLIDPAELNDRLQTYEEVLFLAHCWNIMECINHFDAAFLLYVPDDELARRMTVQRPGHRWTGSPAEVEFMTARHRERQAQARQRGIPFLDAIQPPDAVLSQIHHHLGRKDYNIETNKGI